MVLCWISVLDSLVAKVVKVGEERGELDITLGTDSWSAGGSRVAGLSSQRKSLCL